MATSHTIRVRENTVITAGAIKSNIALVPLDFRHASITQGKFLKDFKVNRFTDIMGRQETNWIIFQEILEGVFTNGVCCDLPTVMVL